MKIRLVHILSLLALGFAGCATFNNSEIGQIRQRGVSPAVVEKMQDGRVLNPSDVIELSRRGVSEDYIVRQINDTGVNYVLHREDIRRLEAARVGRRVMDALLAASADFSTSYRAYGPSSNYGPYAAYPYGYYGPYAYGYPYASPYYGAYPYGGVEFEFGGGRYYGHHHHWR